MDIKYNITKLKDNKIEETKDIISIEEPLQMSLRFQVGGRWTVENISITMRTPGNDEDLIAGFLFNAYSILLSNVHAISEHNSSGTKNDQESERSSIIKRNTTGSGLFPRTASILNHSYDPNTTCIYINGKTQVSNI